MRICNFHKTRRSFLTCCHFLLSGKKIHLIRKFSVGWLWTSIERTVCHLQKVHVKQLKTHERPQKLCKVPFADLHTSSASLSSSFWFDFNESCLFGSQQAVAFISTTTVYHHPATQFFHFNFYNIFKLHISIEKIRTVNKIRSKWAQIRDILWHWQTLLLEWEY